MSNKQAKDTKIKSRETLRTTAVRVDYNDLCTLYGISQTPLIKACISYLVDQILVQQVSASLEIGSSEHQIEWLEEYFKGGNKSNIRHMVEDLLICGFCLIKYERSSQDLPEMKVDYGDNERVTHMTTKNRMTYADPEKEQDASVLSKTNHIIKSIKKIGYIPKRLSPTSCRVTFVSNKYGDPSQFFVYPIMDEVAGMVIKTDSLRDPLENVRVFHLPNTFVTYAISTMTGRRAGATIRVLSDVSSIRDEYTRSFNLNNYSEVTIQRSSNPSWYVFKPRDTVYDMSAPALSDVRFGNDQMTPRDNANYRTFNAKTEMALVKSSHGEQSMLYKQHKKYLEGMIDDEFERLSVSRESWFRQMPYTPPPGYEVGFWPTLPFNESFLKFIETIKTEIAMRFGVQLQGLIGKMSGNTTAEQSMNLMREVSQHKMSELKVTIQSLMLFIGYDCLKSSIQFDMQEDVGSRDEIKHDDEPSSESEFESETSDSESEESSSEDEKKKKKTPNLARNEKEQKRSKHMGGTYGLKLNSDGETESDDDNDAKEEGKGKGKEGEQKKKEKNKSKNTPRVKKPKRKRQSQFTNEIINNITFTIELISSQTNIEEMILLRDSGAVSDYTFNRWAASKFNLPFEEGASKKAKKVPVEAPAAAPAKPPAAKPKPKAALAPAAKPAAKPAPKPTSITAPKEKPKESSSESKPSSKPAPAASAPPAKKGSSESKPKEKNKSDGKGKEKERGKDNTKDKDKAGSSSSSKKKGDGDDKAKKKEKKSTNSSDEDSDDGEAKKKKKPANAPDGKEKEKEKGKEKPSTGPNKATDKNKDSDKVKNKKKKDNSDDSDDSDSDSESEKKPKKKLVGDKSKDKESREPKDKSKKRKTAGDSGDSDSDSDTEPKRKKPKVSGQGKEKKEEKKEKK